MNAPLPDSLLPDPLLPFLCPRDTPPALRPALQNRFSGQCRIALAPDNALDPRNIFSLPA